MTQAVCQSCGLPLGPGRYGTNIDGSPTRVFCKECFVDGAFVDPNASMQEIMERSVRFIANSQDIPDSEARKIAQSMVPKLDRWVI
jgi:hypothetical protein